VILTRLGYFVIALIIATAAVAVIIVLRPDEASTPTAELPQLDLQEVIAYTRYGAVERIETQGTTLRVYFREEFPTEEHFGSDSRVFGSTVPAGQDIAQMLANEGVAVNSENGIEVSAR
jgi:hypothetical protein